MKAGNIALALLLCTIGGVAGSAQQTRGPLNDQRICDLVAAGVSTPEIVRLIASAPNVDFDLRPVSTDALIKLGVSEEIIKAMASRENGATVPVVSASSPTRTKLAPVTASASDRAKLRVFVQESNDSWSYTAGRHWGQGSTHPQTVELMKTFAQNCPELTVTNEAEKAQYRVQFERESNKAIRKHNKMVVFNAQGDLVYASSTRELGNAVRGFCSGIR